MFGGGFERGLGRREMGGVRVMGWSGGWGCGRVWGASLRRDID